MRRAVLSIAAALIVSVFLTSCSSHKETASTTKKEPPIRFTVGVTLLTQQHTFYQELQAAFEEQCKARGIKPIIQSCDMDLPTQTDQVERFITKRVDALVVCPADSAGVAGAIRKANKAGIPVFTADIAAQGGKIVSHIASDNVLGGRLAGEYMVKALSGKGNIAIINHPVVQSVQDRVKGFREAVAKFPGIKIVDDQAAQGQRSVAVNVTENLLRKHAKLDGIFGINDDTALGALQAVENAHRQGIVIIGYDGIPEAREKIAAGTALKADAVQYPREIGKITADTIANYLDGKKVPEVVPVRVGVIDQASLKAEKE